MQAQEPRQPQSTPPDQGAILAGEDWTRLPLSAPEQRLFQDLLLEGTVSAKLPFTWLEDPSIQAALRMLRPVTLPSRRRMAGTMLMQAHRLH